MTGFVLTTTELPTTTGFVLNMTEFLIYMTVWSDLWMPKLYLLPTFDQDIDVQFFFLILKGVNEKTSGKLRFQPDIYL